MSDNNLKSKEDIQKMIALSEEINTLNIKVKQLVEDLSSTQNVLGSVQELAGQLTSKVGDFESATKGYTPPSPTQGDKMGTPSYESAGVKRERIMPTPETIHDYKPKAYTPQPVAVEEESVTSVGSITDKQTIKRETKASQVKRAAGKKKAQSRPPKRGWGLGVGSKGKE
tara:strand:- start:907 stop:1416 length:510 start_codon:yes stop_codon:yes gene_type:complete